MMTTMNAEAEDERQGMKDMGTRCEFCPGTSFRRSRLRLRDLWTLLSVHYPVRCLSCSKRQTVSFPVAWRAVSSRVKQVRAPKNEAPWSGWGSTDGVVAGEGVLRDVAAGEAGGTGGTGGTIEAPAGSAGFSALPVRPAVQMPDLRGVRLRHSMGDGQDQKRAG